MKWLFNSTKWIMLISGVLITILGIIMLFTPLANLVTLALFIGIAMLASGISEIVYCCGEEKGQRSGWMLASGIITTLLGVWTLFGRGMATLIAIIPFIFAVWVMASSIMRIVGSTSLKAEGFSQWGWLLAFGIVGTILGFILLFTPVLSSTVIAFLIAFMLIVYGVDNIIIFFRMNSFGNIIKKRFGK